jgi:hypothetical protein
MESYQVQILDGYTNGRPSWRKLCALREFDLARIAMYKYAKMKPKAKLRIRKMKRKK